MRIGIFGGTFDPPHVGHLVLAEQCREQCRLDRLWLMPAGQPPHKSAEALSEGKRRAEMLELAIAGAPQFEVDRRELQRSGTTFTFETLEEVHGEKPDAEVFFLIGGDSLNDLPTWRNPARILELATVVAVNRGDRPFPHDGPLVAKVGGELAGRIQRVTIPGIDISSTDLRRRVREGRSIRYLTPRAVEAYIAEHRLYRQ